MQCPRTYPKSNINLDQVVKENSMYHPCMAATHAGLCDEGEPITLHGHIDDVAAGVLWI